MAAAQTDAGNGRTRWLIIGMFALLVGLSFFARHVAGIAMAGSGYNALDFNVAALTANNSGSFMFQPNSLLWDETYAYARYAQQLGRGDWFGNTFQTYAGYAREGSPAAVAGHYPFFFDRAGLLPLAVLTGLTRDVSRAFALADLILPLLLALCAVAFCLQLRPSLAFAVLASACFIWFNWSDTATWLSILRDRSVDDGMVFSRTPYPQLAMVTFLLFAIVFLRLRRTPNVLWAILLALTLLLNALTYIYSWILALAVVAMPLLLFVIQRPLALKVERNFVFCCLGALAASVILSAPAWAAYLLSPDIAHDVVTRFADEPVNTPDLLMRTALLIVLAIPLFLPWLTNMNSRVFWLAFWIGGIAAYNQHLVTGIMVQPGHYPPYFFGTFAMIYLIDLALAVWERTAPISYARAGPRVLPVLAAIVVLGGFVAITWRMVSLARAQADFNRANASMTELVTTLNRIDRDYIVLTTDDYLQRLLPAYVKQRFVLPISNDPMTNREVETVQNAAARLLGYADWKAWESNSRTGQNEASGQGEWAFDPERVLLVVNRHHPNRAPTDFSNTILKNQDYVVGVAGQ